MRRCLSIAALLAALFTLAGTARAADAPYAGTWKVKVYFLPPGAEQTLFILKAEAKDAGPKIEVVSSGLQGVKDFKVEVGKPRGDEVPFTIEAAGIVSLKFDVYPPKGEKEPKKLLGSLEIRGNHLFTQLERTTEKELDPKAAAKQAEGATEYSKAARTTGTKEKAAALKEFVEKHADSVLAYQALLDLVGLLPANGAKDAEVKEVADQAVKFAAAYGPAMKTEAITQVTQKLVGSNKAPALAVEYARQVEKALPEGASAAEQIAAAKLLLSALKQAEKKDEADQVSARIAKLDKALDAEYLKNAVPFKTEPFTREGSKNRVVLVELFTGAYCPPCVAADVAFDAALQTYKPQDVVLLQYHLHIPAPDRLTNEDTQSRAKYYPLQGVPSTFVNGGDDLGLGGGKEAGKASFTRLFNTIKEGLAGDRAAKLELTAVQKGDDILISAHVSDLKDPGEGMKLRLALVEDMVRYPGGNGQRFHHHVVRAMPGGVDGFELKKATEKQEVKVNLAELRKSLEKANAARQFRDEEHPFDLKHFKAVAFVQNDKNKEVLQAIQADVQAEK